jgi:hypothetical protein
LQRQPPLLLLDHLSEIALSFLSLSILFYSSHFSATACDAFALAALSLSLGQ